MIQFKKKLNKNVVLQYKNDLTIERINEIVGSLKNALKKFYPKNFKDIEVFWTKEKKLTQISILNLNDKNYDDFIDKMKIFK